MLIEEKLKVGLTFDDVLLVPSESSVLPRDIDVSTNITEKIKLNIPIVSAAMDTVTESKTAIAIAQEGGMGFIHRNLSIHDQCKEVEKVKKFESGVITDPVTISPHQEIQEAKELMNRYGISGLPVTTGGVLTGIITHRDLKFEKDLNRCVEDLMTKANVLITVKDGVSLSDAENILHEHRIEKLPVIDENWQLRGLITVKDIEKNTRYPMACKDDKGRLRVGAAVGVGDDWSERVGRLVAYGVDAVVVDTAHGHSKRVIKAVSTMRIEFPDLDIIAGNVATTTGAYDLIEAGANCIKVGVGPGSICTTRMVAGVGVPQLTAISNVFKAAMEKDIPVIADGGIKYSGDIVKALAAGADAVMIGTLFGGTDESPGDTVLYQGKTYKVYRGMGSVGAMRDGSKDRYNQDDSDGVKLVPEGVEGQVPYCGKLSSIVYQLVGGIRSGMGYTGSRNIMEIQDCGQFIRITPAGLSESHVHDVHITNEALNYRRE